MSFVDLMGSIVWTSADIDAKVQALIRSRVSESDELKAARLQRMGNDPLFVASVDEWISQCVKQGRQARADMVLLHQVLDMEIAARRLAQPVVEPEYDEQGNVINQEAIDLDMLERGEAQYVLDHASPEARELYDKRNPPIEPEEAHNDGYTGDQEWPVS
jgi:hypothetical protein